MSGSIKRGWMVGLLVATALGAGIAHAADEPANLIKYRQATMKAIGGHMGALGAMAKGEVSFADKAAAHAQSINQMSQNLLRLFPEGSGEAAALGQQVGALGKMGCGSCHETFRAEKK